jgi:hypothetical protein
VTDDTLHKKCDRCGVIGQDRRTLYMACLYEMSELGVPFKPVGFVVRPMRYIGKDPRWGSPRFEPIYGDDDEYVRAFYTLTVCKGCRGAWLEAIVQWFRNPTESYLSLNSDENIPERQSLAELLADAERLRTDLVAIQSRVDALWPELRHAHDTWDNLREQP